MSSAARARSPQQKSDSGPEAFGRTSAQSRTLLLCLALVLVTISFYNPVIHNGFTNFDDTYYITRNPHVRAGLTWETVKWAFTSYDASNWHPLTWLSHALDCQIFQINPAGHHYENVLLHAADAILLFLLLQTATSLTWPSLMVAALFALHPVNVQSVAWASERKNTLSMLFFLLTLHAYGWYVRRASVSRYLLVFALFALGLMTKPEIITLPFVLLLWDYWPLRRIQFGAGNGSTGIEQKKPFSFLLLEKLPLLALSAASAVVTLFAQAAGASMPILEFRWRMENAIVAYSRYLGLAFWPTKLAVQYPHPARSLAAWQVLASAILLLALTALVFRFKDRRYLAVGWFWFLGTLVPVIGIVQVGVQAMADRYGYLSFIGLFVAVVWSIAEWARQKDIPGIALGVPAVVVLAILGTLTHHELAYWRDSETLWRHTLSVTKDNSVAHDNLARDLVAQGRAPEAIAEFKAADRLNWYTPTEMLQIGLYEQEHGDLRDAIDEFGRSLAGTQDPSARAQVLSLLGSAFLQAGDLDGATRNYEDALKENPGNTTALLGSGLLAEHKGDAALAVDQISRAVKLEPSDVGFLLLAQALHRQGRVAEAGAAAAQARQLSADLGKAQQTADHILTAAGITPQ